jgi:hypothetical protein
MKSHSESTDEPITTGIPRGSWWLYAAESELIATNFQSIMALKWRSLANGLDRFLSTAMVSSRPAFGTLRIVGQVPEIGLPILKKPYGN